MEYIKLGKSDLNVSRICLGCMGFGDNSIGQHAWTVGEEETRRIIKYALEVGCSKFIYKSDTKSARIQLVKLLIFNTLYCKIVL